ncbi:MAG: polysaccharide biosynthesis/export family protein [Planctomyces sp.]|nr:polysaccharide biosynthesis/export family protein [Planctomyces sp.]
MLPKCSPSFSRLLQLCFRTGMAAIASITVGCATTCGVNSACSPCSQPAECSTCSIDGSCGGNYRTSAPQPETTQECKVTPCSMSEMYNVPRELRKTTLPEYIIEPPDVLLIEAVNNIRPEYAPIHAGEALLVQVNRTIPYGQQEDPVSVQFKQINNIYVIGADGYLNLGPEYGKVLVAEQPLHEIQARVENHLRQILTNPQVMVTLPRPENSQYVAGPHLVRPDGTVGLGIYGSVYVTGMTLNEAKLAIEQHLAQHIHNPQISVDVLAYNSKVYYVIADGGGAGESVVTLPCTGNETVLDAIAKVQGLPTVASKSHIWIARPSADACGPDQILQVDWNAIAQGAQTGTNYQVLPGDRIYVKASQFITFDTKLAKFTAPFERMFGFTLLGNGTVRTIQRGKDVDGGF